MSLFDRLLAKIEAGMNWVLGGLAFACVVAIMTPVFCCERESAKQPNCFTNMRQAGLGVLMYVQDYDERLPLRTAWMSDIYPYVQNEDVFRCPTAVQSEDPRAYGHAFHSPLAGKRLDRIDNAATMPMLYDSGLLYENAALPIAFGLKRPGRHRGTTQGNVIGYLDGHVKYRSDGETASIR